MAAARGALTIPPRGDAVGAGDQALGADDDRDIDHLAVHLERAAAFRSHRRVRLDDLAGVGDVFLVGAEFLVAGWMQEAPSKPNLAEWRTTVRKPSRSL